MYLFDTIDVQAHSVYNPQTVKKYFELDNNAFGSTVWKWTKVIIYPFVIFFRIHSVLALYRVYALHRQPSRN